MSNNKLTFDQAVEAMELGWIVSRPNTNGAYINFIGLYNGRLLSIDPFSTGYPSIFPTSFTQDDLEAIWFLSNSKTRDFVGPRF